MASTLAYYDIMSANSLIVLVAGFICEILTLDLRIVSQVFFYCAPAVGHLILFTMKGGGVMKLFHAFVC